MKYAQHTDFIPYFAQPTLVIVQHNESIRITPHFKIHR